MTLRSFFFFFNDTATTEIYTLSLHDALPICSGVGRAAIAGGFARVAHDPNAPASKSLRFTSDRIARANRSSSPCEKTTDDERRDRKSTRLNSSHSQISYAVFCLKKKKNRPIYMTIATATRNTGHVLYHLAHASVAHTYLQPVWRQFSLLTLLIARSLC